MSSATLWWLLAGGAVVAELLTGTFFLLVLALGLAAGALAAHAGLPPNGQLVAAAAVGALAVVAWHRWRQGRASTPADHSPDVNLDIGQTVTVPAWAPDGSAHVHYRGADWAVVLEKPDATPLPGPYRIVAVQGNRLLVQAI